MTIAEFMEILKTYDPNAVVVLADSAGEQGRPGVVQLRAEEIQSAHSRDSGVFRGGPSWTPSSEVCNL